MGVPLPRLVEWVLDEARDPDDTYWPENVEDMTGISFLGPQAIVVGIQEGNIERLPTVAYTTAGPNPTQLAGDTIVVSTNPPMSNQYDGRVVNGGRVRGYVGRGLNQQPFGNYTTPVRGFTPMPTYNQTFYTPCFVLSGSPLRSPADLKTNWTVTVNGAPATVNVVWRKSRVRDEDHCDPDDYASFQAVGFHQMTLQLAAAIPDGATVVVTPPAGTGGARRALPSVVYNDNVICPAIHIAGKGYERNIPGVKTGSFSWWPGHRAYNGTTIEPESVSGFWTWPATQHWHLVNAVTGTVVKDIAIGQADVPRTFVHRDKDGLGPLNYNFTDVWDLDFGEVVADGTYYIRVPGAGRSPNFHIKDSAYEDVAFWQSQNFMYQRSGQRIMMPWSLGFRERPREGHPADYARRELVQQTRVVLYDTDNAGRTANNGVFRVPGGLNDPAMQKTTFAPDCWGGEWDAADDDTRIQHMDPVHRKLDLVCLFKAVREMPGNLPTNDHAQEVTTMMQTAPSAQGWANFTFTAADEAKMPAVMREANWILMHWVRQQKIKNPDGSMRTLAQDLGAVPGGREASKTPAVGQLSWDPYRKWFQYEYSRWDTFYFVKGCAKMGQTFKFLRKLKYPTGHPQAGQFIYPASFDTVGDFYNWRAQLAYDWASQVTDAEDQNAAGNTRDVGDERRAARAMLYRATGQTLLKTQFESMSAFTPVPSTTTTQARFEPEADVAWEYLMGCLEWGHTPHAGILANLVPYCRDRIYNSAGDHGMRFRTNGFKPQFQYSGTSMHPIGNVALRHYRYRQRVAVMAARDAAATPEIAETIYGTEPNPLFVQSDADAICDAYAFPLGCNPMNYCFVTRMHGDFGLHWADRMTIDDWPRMSPGHTTIATSDEGIITNVYDFKIWPKKSRTVNSTGGSTPSTNWPAWESFEEATKAIEVAECGLKANLMEVETAALCYHALIH